MTIFITDILTLTCRILALPAHIKAQRIGGELAVKIAHATTGTFPTGLLCCAGTAGIGGEGGATATGNNREAVDYP